MFTQAELAANPTLKTFTEQWDAFIDKQREKFAALAEQAAKAAALVVAQQTEDAIKAAANLAAAKIAAQTALTNANSVAVEQERLRGIAEKNAKDKALADAKLQGEREAAEIAKKAAADLAAAITAAADLAASKLKADEAAKTVADAAAAIALAETAAKKAAEDAAKEAAEAAGKVPTVVTPPTNPNASPTGANS